MRDEMLYEISLQAILTINSRLHMKTRPTSNLEIRKLRIDLEF
jgi:hypothetical protein